MMTSCNLPFHSDSTVYTANISSRKIFVVFEVHRSSSNFLSLKVAAAPMTQSPISQLAASANFLSANYKELAHPPITRNICDMQYNICHLRENKGQPL